MYIILVCMNYATASDRMMKIMHKRFFLETGCAGLAWFEGYVRDQSQFNKIPRDSTKIVEILFRLHEILLDSTRF